MKEVRALWSKKLGTWIVQADQLTQIFDPRYFTELSFQNGKRGINSCKYLLSRHSLSNKITYLDFLLETNWNSSGGSMYCGPPSPPPTESFLGTLPDLPFVVAFMFVTSPTLARVLFCE